jgi:N-glycosylase/DNA lyase
VFEDVVKMLCTTNCSWGLTRVMVERLVEKAGARGPGGARAFPTADVLARKSLSFFRDVVRAGYRAPYLKELATRVARGELELEPLRGSSIPSDEVYARLRSITGIGPYAADNLMRLLGHNDRLGLDSWCRARFLKLYPKTRRHGLDAAIARRYRPYAPHSGLAMWLDLTRKWHEPDAPQSLAP